MNLQLALDRLSKEECRHILAETKNAVDWIEIGTGVIKEYGMEIIREIKKDYPEKTIVADMKTCDAAAHETRQALEAGADITTVMAFSDDNSIRTALETAEELNGRVMIDLLNAPEERIAELDGLGVRLVSLHIGKDQQGSRSISGDIFKPLAPYPHMKAAVAGGISLDSIPLLRPHQPEAVIVGSAITGVQHPKKAAEKIKEAFSE
ncbi:3-hexulose-6-phosphate synthase [Alkalicoccus daliensis]|uniref:3-hexulose-6-phosphate synthase n=1 Tax=Alkalicoccus daliensis TaxID=745820 RepID=A0A1H0G7W2_9BACI|nr:3-hexulose-6-phosphate synthase [Alkalicoccus daliensis]SDO02958.1 3-hexulose-6-phosphate synthase [Alkalicoccus daliensis]